MCNSYYTNLKLQKEKFKTKKCTKQCIVHNGSLKKYPIFKDT